MDSVPDCDRASHARIQSATGLGMCPIRNRSSSAEIRREFITESAAAIQCSRVMQRAAYIRASGTSSTALVTGSGPHAGDADAGRTGLDPQAMSQLHADSVALLIGLSIAWWFALRAVGAGRPAVRAAVVLIVVELAQGLIGVVQYLTNLPVALVSAHMLGACLVWLATLAVLWSTRRRAAEVTGAAPEPAATADHDSRPLAAARP